MSEQTRRYIYGIIVAAGAVALFYGLISADSLPLWLGLTAAILGNGLAFGNTKSNAARHRGE